VPAARKKSKLIPLIIAAAAVVVLVVVAILVVPNLLGSKDEPSDVKTEDNDGKGSKDEALEEPKDLAEMVFEWGDYTFRIISINDEDSENMQKFAPTDGQYITITVEYISGNDELDGFDVKSFSDEMKERPIVLTADDGTTAKLTLITVTNNAYSTKDASGTTISATRVGVPFVIPSGASIEDYVMEVDGGNPVRLKTMVEVVDEGAASEKDEQEAPVKGKVVKGLPVTISAYGAKYPIQSLEISVNKEGKTEVTLYGDWDLLPESFEDRNEVLCIDGEIVSGGQTHYPASFSRSNGSYTLVFDGEYSVDTVVIYSVDNPSERHTLTP
jgi:hypothetical protein